MITTAEREARHVLRKSVNDNKPQVVMAEETLRLLRDGDKLNEELKKADRTAKRGGGMEPKSQSVLNLLVGVLLTGLGWWCNNIWASVQSQQNQITQLNVELARNYAPRLELQARFDKIDTALDRIDAQTKGAHK